MRLTTTMLLVAKTMLLVATATLMGCGENGRQATPEAAARVAQGEALFNEHCTECHARGGRGDYLKRIPATLLHRRSEQELVTWILGSDKHREMPNFSYLSEDERGALAAYLLHQIGKP